MTKEFFELLYRFCDDKYLLEFRTLPKVTQKWFPLDGTSNGMWGYLNSVKKGHNVYFGVGLRKSNGGGKVHVAQVPCVWVDVDFKHFPTPSDAKDAVFRALPFGWSIIVDTGGGYHAYAILQEPAEPEDFERIECINRGIARRIGGDLNATDIARILRVPNTRNLKYNNKPLVKVVHADDVTYSLDDLSVFEDLGEKKHTPLELSIEAHLKNSVGIRRCLENCTFLRHCQLDAETLSEPEWWAMISNLCAFRGGRTIVHELSKPYPKYTPEETDRKILQCLDQPIVGCAKIKEIWDCGKTCGVKAPANLAWKLAGSTETDVNPFTEIDKYRWEQVNLAVPKFGFIKEYVEYAESLTDAPRVFHLFSGLTALSHAAVGVSTPGFGGQALRPNLWTVLLAPSSAYRKTTSISIARRLLTMAGFSFLPQEFSQEQLIVELSNKPHTMLWFSEFGKALSMMNREYMAGTKDLLSDLYDCPDGYSRDLRKESFHIERPYITMLGATNIDWMLDKNIRQDLRGGFLARILWVAATSKKYTMDVPPERNVALEEKLAAFLKDINTIRGAEFRTDDLNEFRAQLREEMDRIVRSSEYSLELSAIYTRFQSYAIKLAMLFDLSMGATGGNISTTAWGHAIACIRVLMSTIEDILRQVPLNRDDTLYVEVRNHLVLLHQQGTAWVLDKELAKRMHRPVSLVRRLLTDLSELGIVNVRRLEDKRHALEAQMKV